MKKVLQKSLFRLRALLLMAVMFAIGSSVLAQDATITVESGVVKCTNSDVTLTPSISYLIAWSDLDVYREDMYGSDWGFTVSSASNPIEKIVFTSKTDESLATITANVGDYSNKTWTGSAMSVYFHQGTDGMEDRIAKIEVWLSASSIDPITYLVDFVNAPEGAAATIDGNTYTEDDSWSVAKALSVNSVSNVVKPFGYDCNVSYDSDTHTFTIEYFKIDYVDINTTNNSWSNDRVYEMEESGVHFTGTAYSSVYNLYGGQTLKIETSAPIKKLQFTSNQDLTYVYEVNGKGTYNSSTKTWTASDENTTEVTFQTSGGDYYIRAVRVWFCPAESTDYTIEFVDAPAGAQITLDGQTFTGNDTYTVEKFLSLASITNVVEPEGYYAEKAYDAENHKFTITYKHWYTYNVVVTGHMMGALQYDNNYYGDDNLVFKSKTVVDENEFSAYPLSRYDAAINVEFTGDYTYTVTVKYTAYPTLNINEAAQDGDGNYWTTFSFNKPVSFPEGITPCIVTGEEEGVLTVKEFESVDSEVTTTLDFMNGTVFENNSRLFDESGNEADVTVVRAGGRVESQYLGLYYSSYPTLTFTSNTNAPISKIILTPWGWGSGFQSSLNGGAVVDVPNDPYTYDVNANSCTIAFTPREGSSIYVTKIEIVAGGKTLPVIPANTGILLKSEAAASNIQYEVKEAGNADVTGNLLVAAGAPDYNWNDASKTYYKFSLNGANEEGSVGFYWQVAGGHSLTPTANKAYLVLDGTANVRGFRLDGKADATEGIFNALNGEEEAGAVFNLNGQRVNGKPAAGVYVKNGRKFIVK